MMIPDSPRLISNVIQAHGGAAALCSIQSIAMHGTLCVGTMEGRCETLWERQGRRHVTRVDLGGFSQQFGFDGTLAWSVDSNGVRVNRDDPHGMGESIVQAELRHFEFLIDQREFRFSACEDARGWILEVTHVKWEDAPFASHEFVVDRDSYRIVEQRGVDDGKVFTRRFGDYRVYDGVWIPTLVTEVDHAGNEIVFHYDALLINSEVEDRSFQPTVARSGHVQFPGGKQEAIIRFTRPHKHLFIEVAIDDVPARFVLDTGAERSVIDSALASRLGLETLGTAMGMGVAGAAGYSIVQTRALRVGEIELLHQKMVAMDLSSLQDALPGVEGLLGMDFFNRFVVAFDYGACRLTVFERDAFEYNGDGRSVELVGGRCPMIVNGCGGMFSIDTGSPSLDLFPAFVRQHGMLNDRDSLSTITMVAGLGSHAATFYVDESGVVEIGGYTLRDIPIRMCDDAPGLFANQSIAGNAGSVIWERFVTYFDFDRQVLILEPIVRRTTTAE